MALAITSYPTNYRHIRPITNSKSPLLFVINDSEKLRAEISRYQERFGTIPSSQPSHEDYSQEKSQMQVTELGSSSALAESTSIMASNIHLAMDLNSMIITALLSLLCADFWQQKRSPQLFRDLLAFPHSPPNSSWRSSNTFGVPRINSRPPVLGLSA